MLCERLAQTIPQLVKRRYKNKNFSRVKRATGLTKKEILATKCGLTRETLQVELNFRKGKQISTHSTLSPKYGYFFDLEGITKNGNPTGTDHEFIVIYEGASWWIFDSYLGCRTFTCRIINEEMVLKIVRKLQNKFKEDLWRELTQCSSTDSPDARTSKMNVYLYRYKYHV
jgi:hypothetical protein